MERPKVLEGLREWPGVWLEEPPGEGEGEAAERPMGDKEVEPVLSWLKPADEWSEAPLAAEVPCAPYPLDIAPEVGEEAPWKELPGYQP